MEKRIKLSVVLATRNEENNIARCLRSVKDLADEIIVVDEYSQDRTREIAEEFGAKVYLERHHKIFHITKQKALDLAKGEWILQLDADEEVSPLLRKEIKKVIELPYKKIVKRRPKDPKKWKLFIRHQLLLEQRDGKIGEKTGEIVAFFVPRVNFFLGKPLYYAGVYPDGVIRLVKKGKAFFPQKSVHEQIKIKGEVAWLFNDLYHYDTPTLSRYFLRMNRYTNLRAEELSQSKVEKNIYNFFSYFFFKPLFFFFKLFVRHKGFLAGFRGFLWSFLSAMHYPVSYLKYLKR